MKDVSCEVCANGVAVLHAYEGDVVPLLMYKCLSCGTEWADENVTQWNRWLIEGYRHRKEIEDTTVTVIK